MAKKIEGYIKLQIPAGKANPAPPIGPALGQHGVNIMEFCKAFNARTQNDDPDMKIPVVITVYADRSFTFETKTPPAGDLLAFLWSRCSPEDRRANVVRFRAAAAQLADRGIAQAAELLSEIAIVQSDF